ncbi:MAG: PAS domain S-box protein [Methanomicrobiaceae archaeon]|nr:PAS domain S-box protein [Methanomicrobiaceae archaeon]
MYHQAELPRIKRLLKSHPHGMSITDISRSLKINRNSVAKYLDVLLISGQVEMKKVCTAKLYFATKRTPISGMLRFSSDLICIIDEELQIADINEKFLEFEGYEYEEVLHHSLDDLNFSLINGTPVFQILKNEAHLNEVSLEIMMERDGQELAFKVKMVPTVLEDGSTGTTAFFENITAQKQYELRLADSEALHRSIVEDQTELICRFLPDGTHIFGNEPYCRYFGVYPEIIRNTRFIPEMPESDRRMLRAQLDALTIDHPVCSVQNRVFIPDGSVRWLQWTDRAIFDQDGGLLEYQSVGRDITREKELEAKQKEFFRDITFLSKTAMDLVSITSFAEIFSYITQQVREITHQSAIIACSYEKDSHDYTVRAIAFSSDLHNPGLQEVCSGWQGVKFQEKPPVVEGVPSSRLYRIASVDPSMFLEKSSSGSTASLDPAIFDAYVLDIKQYTEELGFVLIICPSGLGIARINLLEVFASQVAVALQKIYAMGALRLSEERYRSIVEQSSIAIILHHEGKVVFVNEAGCRLLRVERPEDAIGEPILDYVHPESLEMVKERLQRLQHSPCSCELVEEKWIRKDKTTVDVDVMATSSEILGRKTIQVIAWDITSRKRMEKELENARFTLNEVLDLFPDPTFVLDAQKRVVGWNSAMELLTGRKGKDIIGTSNYSYSIPFYGKEREMLIDLLDAPTAKIESMYRNVHRSENALSAEIYIPDLAQEGGKYLLGIAKRIFDRSGNLIGSIESVRDISDLRLLENALLHNSGEALECGSERCVQLLKAINSMKVELAPK